MNIITKSTLLLLTSTILTKSSSFTPYYYTPLLLNNKKYYPSFYDTKTSQQIQNKAFILYSNTNKNTKMNTSKDDNNNDDDPSSMRISEIKKELATKNISCKDCFDKESLVKRLLDARNGTLDSSFYMNHAAADTTTTTANDAGPKVTNNNQTTSNSSTTTTPNKTNTKFDKETTVTSLRSKTVKELRTMCATRGIRWAHMIEKEELVQALLIKLEQASHFSRSGCLEPGKVLNIDKDEILEQELSGGGGDVTTPLLLDVYATWCGPCQLMAPQLEEAAMELGDKVRVAKIDSDKFPEWSSKFKVGALPTVIVFDGASGKELQRVEGALMKDGLVQLALRHA